MESEKQLGKSIIPIVIPTPFAVGDVFSYLIKDKKNVLVDCGHKSDQSYKKIVDMLKINGLKIDDIDEIWLTHGHPDHFGQAALLAEESGAIVRGHAKERANFAANSDRSLFRSFFERHHISPEHIDEMLGQLEWLQQFQEPIEPVGFKEDEELSSGKLHFRVKHTPGHAPGHVVFYAPGGLIFGGDVLLEHISTNALLNFDPDTGVRNKSLLQYRKSLKWIQTLQGLVLPGHGKRIKNIAEVVENHVAEQEERYKQITELLRSKAYTLSSLAETLFPEAMQRGEHFLVFSEIIGYLDWGEQEGSIKREKTGKGIIFKVG